MLFPVSAAVEAEVDIFEVGDSLSSEVAEHTVSVFGGDAGAAVDGGFEVAGVAVEININLADGTLRNDGFDWLVTVRLEVEFEEAEVVIHAGGDFASGGGAFIDNFDGGLGGGDGSGFDDEWLFGRFDEDEAGEDDKHHNNGDEG